MSISHVQAFGVTAPYWKENPLRMVPGETREIVFTLQNMVGDEDMRSTVELIEDKRYVELLGKTEYGVPKKTKDVPVTIRITIPQETPIGTKFRVRISFLSTAKTGAQQVQLGTGIEKTFDVFIGQEQAAQETEAPAPQEEKKTTLLKKPATPALIVILIVFIAWFLLRKSRKKRSEASADGQNARW